MRVVIFLGPSLPLEEARALLPDAVYLPPARQADLLTAVGTYHPDVIGLVDGEFGQSLSVWHKEILYALHRGVAVYGASSMGALRAAETATYGTRGIGRIFDMYASGVLTEDDEVALVYSLEDAGYRKFSEPMVNLRATFQKARDEGVIDAAVCERLVGVAKSLFFPERTFPRIFADAAAAGIGARDLGLVRDFAQRHYVDLKRQDALALLRAICEAPAPAEKARPTFEFQRSALFEALYNRDRRVRHDGFDVPLVSIGTWAALHMPEFNDLNAHALNRALVGVLADMLEIRATDDEVEQEAQRFRTSRQLTEDSAFEEWLARNDFERAEFGELATQLAVSRRLHRWLIGSRAIERTTRLVLDELRLRGDYEDAASAAAYQERILDEHHPDFKEAGFRDLSLEQLVIDHLRATSCRMHVHYKRWAEEAGFHALVDLRVELLRARLAREHTRKIADELVSIMVRPDAEPVPPETEAMATVAQGEIWSSSD